MIHLLDTIIRKRDGAELTKVEIDQFIAAVVQSDECFAQASVTRAQVAAFLMAVFQRGMSRRELADLTSAMRFSGETFDASTLGTFTVDKHSTGGVGDKTSLLIAPIIAAAGIERTPSISVPMISGRSLGHTGGTLDKLETIPGFNTQLPLARMSEVLRETHAVLVGQTPRLVPADRILYAMRDHTGTVESPFLICASIMSKKLAEDLRALVLDVKVGSGAFMPTYEASKFLAELMVSTGELAGTRTVALLTAMNEPLGRFSGNWLEICECVDIMQGKRHPMSTDLVELSNILSGWMLYLANKVTTPEEGAELANRLLENGAAYQSWLAIVRAQGGDISVFNKPDEFHKPRSTRILRAHRSGYLAAMDCKQIGWAVQRLGAGRNKPGDAVSAHAGLQSHVKVGQSLLEGDPLFTLYGDSEVQLNEAQAIIEKTIRVSDLVPDKQPLVREVVFG